MKKNKRIQYANDWLLVNQAINTLSLIKSSLGEADSCIDTLNDSLYNLGTLIVPRKLHMNGEHAEIESYVKKIVE